jgi:hypothetical protein
MSESKYVKQTCSICDQQTDVPVVASIMVTRDVVKARVSFPYGGYCAKCKAFYCFDHIRWAPDPSFEKSIKGAITGRCPVCGEYVGGVRSENQTGEEGAI